MQVNCSSSQVLNWQSVTTGTLMIWSRARNWIFTSTVSNDRPYFTTDLTSGATSSEALEENGNKVIHGQLKADDPDAQHNPGDLVFSIESNGRLVQVLEGKYGVLELGKDGSYKYTVIHPELLESLNPGQNLTQSVLEQEVFNIRVTDPQNAYTSASS